MTLISIPTGDRVQIQGLIKRTIKYKDGRIEKDQFWNMILKTGKNTMASLLTNQEENLFVTNMLFGDGGKDKEVTPDQTSLFGITRVNKKVVAQVVDETWASFTATIGFEEANDYTLNEMALMLNNERLYSMAIFPGFTKNEQIEITWEWVLMFV
jgi:hypothetical protein